MSVKDLENKEFTDGPQAIAHIMLNGLAVARQLLRHGRMHEADHRLEGMEGSLKELIEREKERQRALQTEKL